jgi:hypothetical protein
VSISTQENQHLFFFYPELLVLGLPLSAHWLIQVSLGALRVLF